jgi:flagellar protein FlgJ
MEIGGLRQAYLDNTRFTGGINGSYETGNISSFAELLERSRKEDPSAALAAPSASHSPGKPVVDKSSKLYEQCEALETFLVKTLVTGMRNTVQKSGLIDEGFAGKMYEDMLWDERAKDFTKGAGFGLAELAYLELTGQRGKALANHA